MRSIRQLFEGNANALTMDMNGAIKLVQPKTFASGSYGWHASYKDHVILDGVPARCQVNVCITLIGSKPDDAVKPSTIVEETPQAIFELSDRLEENGGLPGPPEGLPVVAKRKRRSKNKPADSPT